ncbi:MAG: hypothetical protein ABI877_19090 [Gemmatimonadaceae bacterium]
MPWFGSGSPGPPTPLRTRRRRTPPLLALVLAAVALGVGPFDIPLFGTKVTPDAHGHARLVFADSPFGVAVTTDGRHSYDVQLTVVGLPEPSSLGAYTAYVAWAVTTDLSQWHRLGQVTNGNSTVGRAEENKFLLVITAEANAQVTTHAGPTALHGTSPSGWLQSFLSHPLFRGIPP